jgi:ZIP family zinc transporter
MWRVSSKASLCHFPTLEAPIFCFSGALFVILNPTPNLKMLGLLQGFAAGLMLSISFLDLAHNALNSIGFLKGNLWFFAGVLFFGLVVKFIPEPTVVPTADAGKKQTDDDGSGKDMMKKHRRQVLFSGIITAVGKKIRLLYH